ncbi:MAG: SDR family oxidoreductase [Tunicatimonas sp.]
MNLRNRTLFWTLASGAGLLATRFVARQRREIDWADRTVLVTGGSRGLGLELARQLVDAGANVAICARNREDLSRARRILKRRAKHKGLKVKVLALPCDVTDPSQVKKTVATVNKSIGAIDALINNAGIIQVGPLAEMEQREYEEAINTHYWGPWNTIQAVLPAMRERGEGRIINIASVGGKVSIPHLHPYSASKHALVGLSEGYRAELLRENIYVTTVCPGLIRTGSPKNAIYKGQHREEQTWFTISDSLPGFTMSSGETARAILEAGRYGKSTVVLSLPAKLLVGLNGVAPQLVSEVSGLINRWLPDPGGIGSERASGEESASKWSPSFLTTLTQRAARSNNQ